MHFGVSQFDYITYAYFAPKLP